ncbi:c-type cytochrome [Rhizobium sp. GR12]|uniref:c-type cytochrome n=1 Tax=Rhizobium sp. GR12 TaxID=3053925 RepID=UPI002FBE81B3
MLTERGNNLSSIGLWFALGTFLAGAAVFAGCFRETRTFRTDPPISAALDKFRLMPVPVAGAPAEVYFALGRPFERTAYDLSQGKRLYAWFGCAACHGEGEGGKGPPFLDGQWLYGPSMVSVAASIRDGRPNGMPPFRDKMTSREIWQLAGYVRTIGAYSALIAAPARNDDRQTRPAENRAPAAILFKEDPVPPRPPQGALP